MVIWVTGLAGSGKTTLCRALYKLLKPVMPELVVLDGDAVREAFGRDLGYSEAQRVIQIKRLQGIAKLLSDQGCVVLVAALYAHPELLDWNRHHFSAYFEVYLKASLDTVRRRDSKGLYAKAARGETAHVVGLDVPWRPPVTPDLVLEMDTFQSPIDLASQVAKAVPRLAAALKSEGQCPS